MADKSGEGIVLLGTVSIGGYDLIPLYKASLCSRGSLIDSCNQSVVGSLFSGKHSSDTGIITAGLFLLLLVFLWRKILGIGILHAGYQPLVKPRSLLLIRYILIIETVDHGLNDL